jgi:U3 small nucleolar RNA-associated protein 6
MAEHVQAALDLMVAPLQDLQERGVFAVTEIRAVVNRRRDSEYALRRRQPRKADFLRYLQAEMDLEKLRQLRSKSLLQKQRQQEQKDKSEGQGAATDTTNQNQNQTTTTTTTKHIGDKHIIQHIHLLWVRTLRKYRADVALYLQYADFCKETGSFRKLSQCYSQALQLHPKEPGLWIEAASHEFFQAGSVPAARVLLQRGLRINGTAMDLWVQYFGLELHFVQKMQGRRNILMGGSAGNSVNVKKISDDEEDEEEPSLETEKEEEDDEEMVQGASAVSALSSNYDAHAMAKIVYDNAIAAVSDNVAFRLRFLDQCRLFPDTVELAQHIVDSIQKDAACQGQPEAWIARAMYAWEKSSSSVAGTGAATEAKGFVQEPSSKRQKSSKSATPKALANSDSVDPVLAVLEEATETLQTEDMYLQAIRFLRSYMEQLEPGNGADNDNDDDEEDSEEVQETEVNPENERLLESARTFLEKLFKDASTRDFYGSDLVSAHVDYLESCEEVEDAVNVLEAFFKTKAKPAAEADDKFVPAELWTDWARLVAFSQSTVAGIRILQKALKQIPMAEPDHVMILLELLGAKLMAGDEAEGVGDFTDIFQRILLLAPGFEEMLQDIEDPSFGISNVSIACLEYLRYKINKEGVAGARVVYNAVLFQSSLGKSMAAECNESIKAFVDESIEAEMNEDKTTAAAKNHLRRLFDVVVDAFADTSLEDEYRRKRNEVVIYG